MNIADTLNSSDIMDNNACNLSETDHSIIHAGQSTNDNCWSKETRPFGCSKPDELHHALEQVLFKFIAGSHSDSAVCQQNASKVLLQPLKFTPVRLELASSLMNDIFKPIWDRYKLSLAQDKTIVAFRRIIAHIVVENHGKLLQVFSIVQDLWDIAIIAGQQGFTDDVIAFRLIHDFLDFMTVDCTDSLFSYLDSRVEIMTLGMQSERGRGLFLLRFCNDFLRRMSKSKHNVVCGKLLTLVSNTYPLSERSGVNVRGEYNVGNVTVFEPASNSNEMDDNKEPNLDSLKTKAEFYHCFWSLQEYFSNPTLLFDISHFTKFQTGVEKVVKIFDDIQKESDQNTGSDRERRKVGEKKHRVPTIADARNDYFFPKFLTSTNLFDLELNDPFFRRQILLQIMIVFQFLSSLVSMEKEKIVKQFSEIAQSINRAIQYAYVLTADQESWVSECRSRSFKVLERISPNGKKFSKTLLTVLMHERNWLKWKLGSCSSYEKPIIELGTTKKRRKAEHSAAANKSWLGNQEMTNLWERGRDLKQVLRDKASRSIVTSLDEHLKELDYQLEEDCETLAEGIEDPSYVHYNNMRYNWIAYRTAIKSHAYLFSKKETRNDGSKPLDPNVPKSAAKSLVVELLREWRKVGQKNQLFLIQNLPDTDQSVSATDLISGQDIDDAVIDGGDVEKDDIDGNLVQTQLSRSSSAENISESLSKPATPRHNDTNSDEPPIIQHTAYNDIGKLKKASEIISISQGVIDGDSLVEQPLTPKRLSDENGDLNEHSTKRSKIDTLKE
ncbi:hypothetical protein QVD99_004433 [Batrachochytrium dendrobatidis]|nr:hypothetical protein O5D80_002665 [Batrachochytrium dendrobatidis]KAK5668640.1 hypothetical protein QVD99_004433 [Batrachochytrium dendrobatidis]